MNPLFKQYVGSQGQNGGILQQFGQFMEQMKGKNPNDVINQLVSEGKVNEDQLNQVKTRASKCRGFLSRFSV